MPSAFTTFGSILVTIALAPLALGIAGDFYIAASKMLNDRPLALAAAVVVALVALWYVLRWCCARRWQDGHAHE